MHRTRIRRNWGQEVRDSRRTATLGAVAVSSSFVVAVRPVGCVGKRIIIRLASPKVSGQGRELSLLTAISWLMGRVIFGHIGSVAVNGTSPPRVATVYA